MRSFVLLFGYVLALVRLAPAHAQSVDALSLVQTIKLPDVNGRIDHMAIDADGQRLFVAGVGNNTLEVIDLKAGKVARQVAGLHEPQGVAFLSGSQTVAVANGGDGSCRFFSAENLKPLGTLNYDSDADNLRYDAAAQRLYVGFGSGAIGVIDAATRSKISEIKLPGHPEAFQLEQRGTRIFVNVPTAKQIVVIDRQSGKVADAWPIQNASANFPMALDEDKHRLYVGCRQPAEVLIYDTDTGKRISSFATVGDTDDLFYDGRAKRLYVAGGDGFLISYKEEANDRYVELAKVATAPGARTALFVSSLNRVYVAIPHHGTKDAEIRAYSTR
jgi:YVTN family beta-propeller protein